MTAVTDADLRASWDRLPRELDVLEDVDYVVERDPRRRVFNCGRCGALTRAGHDCEAFLAERGRVCRRSGSGALANDDPLEVDRREARGIWWH